MHLVPLSEFNPCHDPRDGKFADKGVGDCEPGHATDLEAQVRKSADTPEETKYAKEIAQAELANRKMLAEWGPRGTKSKYFDEKTGEYTTERQKLHDEIIQKVLTHEVTKAGWKPRTNPLEPQQHPVAVMMSGMTASGKTTAAAGLDYSNKLAINSDDIKTLFPEWTGSNASVLHDESNDIVDRLIEIGRANKYNMVLDSTMKDLGGVDYETARYGGGAMGRIKSLKQAGYRVEARFTDVDINTSVSRSLQRYMKQRAETGKGRYVPIGYIKSNYDKQYGTRPRRTFEKVKHLFDAYVVVDNRGAKATVLNRHGKLTEVAPPHVWGFTALDEVYWRADEPGSYREVVAAQRYAENFQRRFQRRGSMLSSGGI